MLLCPFVQRNGDMKISVPSLNNKEPQVFKKQGDIVFAEKAFLIYWVMNGLRVLQKLH
jgi:hypothetical protein